MAYGSSFSGQDGLVTNFADVMSDEASKALGAIGGQKFKENSELAGQFINSKAHLAGQEALARAEMYKADKAASMAPFEIVGGIVGAGLSSFTGGLGAAAGKKWFA
jgi:hypothetical protein